MSRPYFGHPFGILCLKLFKVQDSCPGQGQSCRDRTENRAVTSTAALHTSLFSGHLTALGLEAATRTAGLGALYHSLE